MEYSRLPIVATAAMLLLSGCAGLADRAYLPPDEVLLCPYSGTILVVEGDSPQAFGWASTAEYKPALGMWIITLPKHADDRTRACLFVTEMGNIKGGADVNRVPVRDRVSPLGYERTCATVDIETMARKLAAEAMWATYKP